MRVGVRKFFGRTILIAVAAVLPVAPTGAQISQDDVRWCSGEQGTLPDQQIKGCTVIIQSGRGTEQDRALVYRFRGAAYQNKGQYDRAIQDFDEAIALNPNDDLAFYER